MTATTNGLPRLNFHLKRQWFDQVRDGSKRTEYRSTYSPLGARLGRLLHHDFWEEPMVARIMLGYPPANAADRILDFFVLRVRLEDRQHEHWGSAKQTLVAVDLGPRVTRGTIGLCEFMEDDAARTPCTGAAREFRLDDDGQPERLCTFHASVRDVQAQGYGAAK